MTRVDSTHGHRGAFFAAAAVFVISFVWSLQASMLVPHQGVHSLLAARSLIEGNGFEVAPGIPFSKFGPFYPLALAALGRAGLDVKTAVYLLNCAAWAGCLWGLAALCRRLGVRLPSLALVLYGVLASNYYLLRSARPDLIVVCAATLSLLAMSVYVERRSTAALLAAAAGCAVAATSRYMAVFALLPIFLLALWLARVRAGRRLRDLLLFGFVAAAPAVAWLTRNYLVTGFLTGMSRTRVRRMAGGEHSFGEQFVGLLRTVWIDAFSPDAIGLREVVYGQAWSAQAVWMSVAALVVVALLTGVAWRHREGLRSAFVTARRRRSIAYSTACLVAAYLGLYTVVLLVVWSTTNNDPINTRYVSPLYGYAIALGALLFMVVNARETDRAARIAIVVILLLVGGPNLLKTTRLLGDPTPPKTLVDVHPVGERGTNWIETMAWSDLDAIELPREEKLRRRSKDQRYSM